MNIWCKLETQRKKGTSITTTGPATHHMTHRHTRVPPVSLQSLPTSDGAINSTVTNRWYSQLIIIFIILLTNLNNKEPHSKFEQLTGRKWLWVCVCWLVCEKKQEKEPELQSHVKIKQVRMLKDLSSAEYALTDNSKKERKEEVWREMWISYVALAM